MKILKSMELPLDLILRELKNSEPRYIVCAGLRISLYGMAANLITSLLSQVDEAEDEKREAYALMDKLYSWPSDEDIRKCIGKSEQNADNGRVKAADGITETPLPEAIVVAAAVKRTHI